MKRFKFRLERVLNFRSIVKHERQRELADALRALSAAEKLLRELESEQITNAIPEKMVGSVNAIELVMRYAFRLRETIAMQRLTTQRCQELVEVARAAYIEAARDERTLTTLKTKRLSEHRELADKEEASFLDEFTIRNGNTLQPEEVQPDEIADGYRES